MRTNLILITLATLAIGCRQDCPEETFDTASIVDPDTEADTDVDTDSATEPTVEETCPKTNTVWDMTSSSSVETGGKADVSLDDGSSSMWTMHENTQIHTIVVRNTGCDPIDVVGWSLTFRQWSGDASWLVNADTMEMDDSVYVNGAMSYLGWNSGANYNIVEGYYLLNDALAGWPIYNEDDLNHEDWLYMTGSARWSWLWEGYHDVSFDHEEMPKFTLNPGDYLVFTAIFPYNDQLPLYEPINVASDVHWTTTEGYEVVDYPDDVTVMVTESTF